MAKKFVPASDEEKAARIDSALESVVKKFENGEAPQIMAKMLFDSAEKPCAGWSPLNQLIAGANDTADARTYKQWQAVERQVQKGAHGFYIFAPIIKKRKDEVNGEEVEKSALLGYKLMPVFRVEDTAGAELPMPDLPVTQLPFFERAEEWNIPVRAEGFRDLSRLLQGRSALGVYRQAVNAMTGDSIKEEIVLATPDESVFLHELSHAAQTRVENRKIDRVQHALYEVVAEFSAAVLSQLVGIEDQTHGESYQYIKRHAEEAGMDLHRALNHVLADVKSVVNLIVQPEKLQLEKKLDSAVSQDVSTVATVVQPEAVSAEPLSRSKSRSL